MVDEMVVDEKTRTFMMTLILMMVAIPHNPL